MLTALFYSLRSLQHRWFVSCLSIVSIALSVFLLLGIDLIKESSQSHFEGTISQTDMVVGARNDPLNILLYSVFHIGNPQQSISFETYKKVSQLSDVKWTIPISLGDSHRGYRVVGTSQNFFEHYRYSRNQALRFSLGKSFEKLFDVVLGAQVAEKLGYDLKSQIVLSHGISSQSIESHDDKPFQVIGVLDKTGTPLDQSLFVSLEAIEAIHIDWSDGSAPSSDQVISGDQISPEDLVPQQLTAVYLGLKSRFTLFKTKRQIELLKEEPLTAVLPGLTLKKLWNILGGVTQALTIIMFFVFLVSLVGLLSTLYSSLYERKGEINILRTVGMSSMGIFISMIFEALFTSLLGFCLGALVLLVSSCFLQEVIMAHFGVMVESFRLNSFSLYVFLGVSVGGLLGGLLPAFHVYLLGNQYE